MAGKTCGKCGSPNMSTARFCARCGAPLAAGAKAPAEPQQPFLLRALMWLLALFPGLVRPKVVVLFILAIPIAAGLAGLGLSLLMLGLVFTGPAIAAFGLLTYWTAWAWVFFGDVCMPADALAEFGTAQWLLMLLVTALPIAVVAVLLHR
jgi:hypothetical protein